MCLQCDNIAEGCVQLTQGYQLPPLIEFRHDPVPAAILGPPLAETEGITTQVVLGKQFPQLGRTRHEQGMISIPPHRR